MQLREKVVLITGASDGIGAACVPAFRKRGARLVLASRSEEKMARLAGPDDLVCAGDLTQEEARQRAVDAAMQRFGRIDVLVNNAGVGLYAPSWRAPLEEARRMFELNYFAALGMIQLVVPQMRERRNGSLVNVASIAGKVALPWLTIYSSSKFALCSLTDGLRMELRQFHIHCMAVCPGYVKTGFQQNALAGKPPDRLWRQKRFAITAEQCAEALVRGVEREKRTVVTPGVGWLLSAGRALFPKFVDGSMEKIYLDLDFS